MLKRGAAKYSQGLKDEALKVSVLMYQNTMENKCISYRLSLKDINGNFLCSL